MPSTRTPSSSRRLGFALFSLVGGALFACSAAGGGADSGTDAADTDGTDGGDFAGTGGHGTDGLDGLDGLDGVDGTGGGTDGNICQSYTATNEPNPPAVLILLDQSGSMKAAESSTTRWAAATSSVIEAVNSLDDQLDFGLIGFPTHVISSDTDASQTCNAELKVAPLPNNGAALEASIDLAVPQIGHTPVRAALTLARSELAKPEYAQKSRYVVLVTDGLPNCKGILPTSSATSGFANYEDPSDAVTLLTGDGVTTYVVGYNIASLSEWSEGTQHNAVTYANNMAAAGGTGTHRAVSTGAELQAVLADISAEVAPCTFELDEAPRGGATYARVSIDGVDYAFDEAGGWVLEGDKTIVFPEGEAACDLLRDGETHAVDVQVECEPVVVR